MVLYQVHLGVIKIFSVKKETACGWREHNGGFINRRVLSEKFPSIDAYYYTTCDKEALKWAKFLRQKLSEVMQISSGTISDLIEFQDCGLDESLIPKSRF